MTALLINLSTSYTVNFIPLLFHETTWTDFTSQRASEHNENSFYYSSDDASKRYQVLYSKKKKARVLRGKEPSNYVVIRATGQFAPAEKIMNYPSISPRVLLCTSLRGMIRGELNVFFLSFFAMKVGISSSLGTREV